GLPARPGLMAAQAGQLLPGPAAVRGAEERSVLDAGVDEIGVRRRGLEVPDARELPRVLRAVVPLVCRERPARFRGGVVGELVALAARHAGNAAVVLRRGIVRRGRLLPGFPAVAGTLDDLP